MARKGDIVKILNNNAFGWYKIQTIDGNIGFIMMNYVDIVCFL